MEKPVVDQVFEALLKGEPHLLEKITRPEDAIHIRSAISTNNPTSASLDIDLEEITRQAPWITPLFLGPKIHFFSLSTSIQSRISGRSSIVPLDWSFSFDSNVAEKVRAYTNHENINKVEKKRVITLLKIKRKYNIQTDLMPFIFENMRLSRHNKENKRPLNTIAAFKMIEYIDWIKFDSNPNKPVFNCDTDKLLQEAEDTYNDLVNEKEVKKREYKALFTQVILFELAIQWLKKPNDPEFVFSQLIDFCVVQLKKLPKYELLIVWDFLKQPKKVRFFGPLADVGKKLIKDLKGIAWDISHLRTLETMSTMSQKGAFFIPFFVSFDEKFSEILKKNQISILVIDDRLKRMHSAGINELDFQIQLTKCMSDKVKELTSLQHSEKRRKSHIQEFDLKHILSHQEIELKEIADDCRKSK